MALLPSPAHKQHPYSCYKPLPKTLLALLVTNSKATTIAAMKVHTTIFAKLASGTCLVAKDAVQQAALSTTSLSLQVAPVHPTQLH